jgi:HPt (histidine-containing phosphotransfer) domain-containing protein
VDSLLHRCSGKTELATKLISKFQNRIPQDLMELQQCIEDRDSVKLIDCAHKLKSVAASLGAESIQQVADKLQEIGRHDCLDEAPDQMDELRKQCDRFNEHFQSIAAHGILQPQHKPS